MRGSKLTHQQTPKYDFIDAASCRYHKLLPGQPFSANEFICVWIIRRSLEDSILCVKKQPDSETEFTDRAISGNLRPQTPHACRRMPDSIRGEAGTSNLHTYEHGELAKMAPSQLMALIRAD